MRKQIADIIRGYFDFTRKHRFFGLLVSLVVAAACAGAVYLIIANFPRYIPCITGGCVG
ncbi:MAG: hypothetical protein M0025_05750 [Elusimicrobia bacterium]|nr:hypothetical protein [Elusimicrobiota bacterium]